LFFRIYKIEKLIIFIFRIYFINLFLIFLFIIIKVIYILLNNFVSIIFIYFFKIIFHFNIIILIVLIKSWIFPDLYFNISCLILLEKLLFSSYLN
jgi:hypothetical protein